MVGKRKGEGHEYSEGLLICMQGLQVGRNWVSDSAVSLIFGTVPDTESVPSKCCGMKVKSYPVPVFQRDPVVGTG